MKDILKIANAQAFWGDRYDAAATLMMQQPDLDYISLDYLSEVSLSIMAVQKEKDPHAGYAKDFIDVVISLVPFWKKGSKVKIVTNAGGLDPKRCGEACQVALEAAGCPQIKIGIVSGDDVLVRMKNNPTQKSFNHLESGISIASKVDVLATANAYMGAKPIEEAILQGADIVITGRVADPSLVVGPCVAHFKWKWTDYDRLAQATLAGHLIECGTQVTGGIATDWLTMPDVANVGFPFVEMSAEGVFTLTKPKKSGGRVNLKTVKEQLLYEIGDPSQYLSPDVTLSFLDIKLKDDGDDRVVVSGAKGKLPPTTLKVSATYRDGYKAEGMLAIFGNEAAKKAKQCGEIILLRVQQAGFPLERTSIECLGAGAELVPGIGQLACDTKECVLRVCVADQHYEAVECFTKQIAPMVTSGPQGTTGYTSGRPHIRPVFGYWPCLISASDVESKVEILEVKHG